MYFKKSTVFISHYNFISVQHEFVEQGVFSLHYREFVGSFKFFCITDV